MEIEEIINMVKENPLLDGITLTGGGALSSREKLCNIGQ